MADINNNKKIKTNLKKKMKKHIIVHNISLNSKSKTIKRLQ